MTHPCTTRSLHNSGFRPAMPMHCKIIVLSAKPPRIPDNSHDNNEKVFFIGFPRNAEIDAQVRFCRAHKQPGDIDLRSLKCKYQGCNRQPSVSEENPPRPLKDFSLALCRDPQSMFRPCSLETQAPHGLQTECSSVPRTAMQGT